ncbi:MAG: hypothetical protein AB7N54_19110 [Alphaproteobacteria bacterium]
MHEPNPGIRDLVWPRPPLSTRRSLLAGRVDVVRVVCVLMVCALAAVPSLASALGRPWTITPDHDFIAVYNALLFNTGLPQENFDFTAYPLYLALAAWFRLYEAFGLVAIADFATLQAAGTWEESFAELIAAGRVLMLVFGVAMTLTVYLVLRRMVVWPAAIAMTAVFAVSQGLAVNLHLIRPDLPSAFFYLAATGALLLARRWDVSLPFRLAFAAALAWLSIQAKLQTVPAVFALFLLAQFVLPAADDDPDPHDHDYFEKLADMGPAWLFFGFVTAMPLLYEIWQILDGNGFKIMGYQVALAGFAIANMVVYWLRTGVPGIAATTVGALLAGLGIAHLLHYVHPSYVNIEGPLYFIDVKLGFVGEGVSASGEGYLSGTEFDAVALGLRMLDGVWFVLAGKVLEWRTLVWGACIWIGLGASAIDLLRGRWRRAMLPLALILLALGIDVLASLRRQPIYPVFVEMLAVLGCAVAVQHLFARTAPRRVRALAIGCAALLVVASTAINLDSRSPLMTHPSLAFPPTEPCTITRAFNKRMAHVFDHYCRPE